MTGARVEGADDNFMGRMGRAARTAFAGALALGLVVLLAAAAGVVAIAALAIAAIVTLGAGLFWLIARFAPRAARGGKVLVARRGPHGWTVDVTR